MDSPFVSLADLPHIDSAELRGRSVILTPMWDGSSWQTWVPVEGGKLLRIAPVGVMRSKYLAKTVERDEDLHIPFLHLMWQHMSWPEIARTMGSLSEDIHLMATSAAKLEHFHHARAMIGPDLITTFVNSEIEHLLVIARSVFDLLQEAMMNLWKDHVQLNDPVLEKARKAKSMKDSFRSVVLEDEKPRTAEEIAQLYSLPLPTAAMYAKHAQFFKKVRGARDQVVHSGKTLDSVYATERGFCVDPKAPYFRDFLWSEEHHYNENLVTLVPWVAWLVAGTLEACSDIIQSLAGQIEFPPPLAPGLYVFLRDPCNPALMRLVEAAQGPHHWWHDMPPDTLNDTGEAGTASSTATV